MASMTSDTGDTSSKQQQAQCKENYNKSKRPVVCVWYVSVWYVNVWYVSVLKNPVVCQ